MKDVDIACLISEIVDREFYPERTYYLSEDYFDKILSNPNHYCIRKRVDPKHYLYLNTEERKEILIFRYDNLEIVERIPVPETFCAKQTILSGIYEKESFRITRIFYVNGLSMSGVNIFTNTRVLKTFLQERIKTIPIKLSLINAFGIKDLIPYVSQEPSRDFSIFFSYDLSHRYDFSITS